jgi:hypothetical protein
MKIAFFMNDSILGIEKPHFIKCGISDGVKRKWKSTLKDKHDLRFQGRNVDHDPCLLKIQ